MKEEGAEDAVEAVMKCRRGLIGGIKGRGEAGSLGMMKMILHGYRPSSENERLEKLCFKRRWLNDGLPLHDLVCRVQTI